NHKRDFIFISYSRRDAKVKDELLRHLAPLRRQYDIHTWSDSDIPPAADWRQAIQEGMERASLVVLLISSNFLASDFCMDVELSECVRARSDRGLRLVAVIVSDCFWQGVPDIERYQVLPRDAMPIKSRTSRSREGTWVSIVKEIVQLLSL